ncbi:MAG: hypothetical protein Q7R51_02170 [bacterium]|nr:hypothetical protein [bacterium]
MGKEKFFNLRNVVTSGLIYQALSLYPVDLPPDGAFTLQINIPVSTEGKVSYEPGTVSALTKGDSVDISVVFGSPSEISVRPPLLPFGRDSQPIAHPQHANEASNSIDPKNNKPSPSKPFQPLDAGKMKVSQEFLRRQTDQGRNWHHKHHRR